MRWTAFYILAYFALGIQTGISAFTRIESSGSIIAEPNFVLLAVVFIAINAPRDVALLGCFILGAMQDITTQGTFGLHALSYGLSAMILNPIAHAVYREHPLTHFACALLGGVLTAMVLLIHHLFHKSNTAAVGLTDFAGALYSAILAPFIVGALQRGKRVFAFQSSRRKIRAWGSG